MRNYVDYRGAVKMAEVMNLINRVMEGLHYLISLRTLGTATQRVRLQPEVIRVVRR